MGPGLLRRGLTRLGALYGGRHLRTTLALGVASAAAGGVTGMVGFGVAGAPAGHERPAPVTHHPAAKHRHPATAAPTTSSRPLVEPKRTKSPTPKSTPTMVATKAPPPSSSPTQPPTPSSMPTSTAPSASPSAPGDGASPPPQ